MLELERLQPMPADYDKELFNQLYSKTNNLRRKLASEIDANRFGLCYEDILSFFDVKFIFVFTKHYKEPENILLGFILNSLKNFKCRILRSAYTTKFSQHIMSTDSVLTLEDDFHESHPVEDIHRQRLQTLMDFMKEHLSMNAYTVFELQLNPPPYIHAKLNTSVDANLRKIPDHIILDYLDLGNGPKAYKYLESLKKEIKHTIAYAKSQLN